MGGGPEGNSGQQSAPLSREACESRQEWSLEWLRALKGKFGFSVRKLSQKTANRDKNEGEWGWGPVALPGRVSAPLFFREACTSG